jgi:hypothetical protein
MKIGKDATQNNVLGGDYISDFFGGTLSNYQHSGASFAAVSSVWSGSSTLLSTVDSGLLRAKFPTIYAANTYALKVSTNDQTSVD